MSEHLLFPWLTAAIAGTLAGAWAASRAADGRHAKRWGIIALSASLLFLFCASVDLQRDPNAAPHLEPWGGSFFEHVWELDELNAAVLPLFAALALGLVGVAPLRKVTPAWIAGMLVVTAGTLIAYAATNLPGLCAGWCLAAAPFVVGQCFSTSRENRLPPVVRRSLMASMAALIATTVLLMVLDLAYVRDWEAFSATGIGRQTAGPQLWVCGAFLVLAILLRKGLAPFHLWSLSAFEQGPLLPLMLLVNGHLGGFVLARVGFFLLPEITRQLLPLVAAIGLISAGITALMALVEPEPRRLLGLLSISQASFILVGIASGNREGIAGALAHWQVVTVSTAVLAAVFAAVEARLGCHLDSRSFRGLALGAPRLAVFFVIGALALVGMPLTLGFPAEDLLLQGTLGVAPWLGIVLPLVTALNAYSVIRLFARLFLGSPGPEVRGLADALRRERLVLTAAVLYLLIGGLTPAPFLRLPILAGERLTLELHPGHTMEEALRTPYKRGWPASIPIRGSAVLTTFSE